MNEPVNYATNPRLVLDTETSGLFDFSKPADADGQPRLASVSMILTTPDLRLMSEYNRLIKPDGWTLSDEAAAINGLTAERLEKEGVPVREVLTEYVKLIDEGYIIIAYNAQYDTKVMRGELRRAGMDDRFAATPNVCVMRPLMKICGMRSANNRPRWPKLEEALQYFKLPLPDKHTAAGDARGALDIARILTGIGEMPEPKVHFAKERPQ